MCPSTSCLICFELSGRRCEWLYKRGIFQNWQSILSVMLRLHEGFINYFRAPGSCFMSVSRFKTSHYFRFLRRRRAFVAQVPEYHFQLRNKLPFTVPNLFSTENALGLFPTTKKVCVIKSEGFLSIFSVFAFFNTADIRRAFASDFAKTTFQS